jgi:hypothetical protein
MITQDYIITVAFSADVKDGDPKDWLPQALREGNFKYKTNKIYSTEVEPIDRSNPKWKFLDDLDKV